MKILILLWRMQWLISVVAALVLTAGILFPLSDAVAQESPAQVTSPVSWACNGRGARFNYQFRCRSLCLPSGGASPYYPISAVTGQQVVSWNCPNSNFREWCGHLRQCLGFGFLEEECVENYGWPSSDICHENGVVECAAQAQAATQATCQPEITCEAPLVPNYFALAPVCECPDETHREVDGECIPIALAPKVTISFLPVQNGILLADYETSVRVTVEDGDAIPHGTNLVIDVRADSGYYISRLTGGCEGESISAVSGRSLCRRRVTVNFSVGAEFLRAWDVDFSWTPQDGGMLESSGGELLSFFGDEAGDGAIVTLRASPFERFYVSGWSNSACTEVGDSASAGVAKECVLTVNEDLSAVVTFTALPPLPPVAPSEHTVYYSRVPASGVGGTLTVSGLASGGTVAIGSRVTFAASPAEGFYVLGWSAPDCAGNHGDAANPQVEKRCEQSADSDLFVTVTFAETITPRWACSYGFFTNRNLNCEAICPHPHGDYPATADGAYVLDRDCPDSGGNQHCNELRFCLGLGFTEEECVEDGYPSSQECHEKGDAECGAVLQAETNAACVPPERILPRSVPLPPLEPPALRRSPFIHLGPGVITVRWTSAAINFDSLRRGVEVSHYEISREVNGSGNFVSVAVAPRSGSNEYLDSSAPLGVTLRYQVRAHSNVGPGPFSDASLPLFVPPGAPPPPPGAPVAILQPNHTAFLQWPRVEGGSGSILGYQVFLEINGSGNFEMLDAIGDREWYVHLSTPGGSTLRYKVRSENRAGVGGLSEASNAVVTPPEVGYSHIPADGSGGTLSAEVADGSLVAQGATVTFTAAPAADWRVAGWNVSSCDSGAADETVRCALSAAGNLYVTATFAAISGAKRAVGYSHIPADGRGGTLTVAGVADGELVDEGATVTFTAVPASGWYVSAWGHSGCGAVGSPGRSPRETVKCALEAAAALFVTVHFARNCAGENRAALNDPLACGDCLESGGLEFMEIDSGGLCLHWDDFGDVGESDVCLALRPPGGKILEGGGRICSDVDANDTFCILDSDNAFPCRGLFRHVLRCNLAHNRRALNPFFCGERCPNGAAGKDCLPPPTNPDTN